MPENPGARRASTSAKLSRSISSGCHRVDAFAAGAVLPLKSPSSKMRNGLPGSTTEADECALGLTSRCTEPKEDLMVTAANSSCRVSVANYQSWGSLASCGRLSIGQMPRWHRTAAVANRRAGCQPAPHRASVSTFMSCTPEIDREPIVLSNVIMKTMVTDALRSAAKASFRLGGGIRVARWLNRHSLRILMYHRFGDRASLQHQCAHIRQYYAPVTLDQAAQAFGEGNPLPAKALAVTVDDGYRDFFEVAYPVFREFGIPATVFVVTRFLDGGYWLWGDRVKYAFRHTPLERTRLALPDGGVLTYELPDGPARERAATQVKERAKLM